MSKASLHYIYDPVCGWCSGTAPLIKAAQYHAQGFPTLLLEVNGQMRAINHSVFYGGMDGFVQYLKHVKKEMEGCDLSGERCTLNWQTPQTP